MFQFQENADMKILGNFVLLCVSLSSCIANHIPVLDANVLDGLLGIISMHIFHVRVYINIMIWLLLGLQVL